MLKRIRTGLCILVMAVSADGWSSAAIEVFDSVKANQQLDAISVALKKMPLDYSDLSDASKSVAIINAQAEKCMVTSKVDIQKVSQLLEVTSPLPDEQIHQHQLLEEKQSAIKKLATCSLVGYRAQELLAILKNEMLRLDASSLFDRSTPIVRNFNPQLFSQFSWDMQRLYQYSGIGQLNRAEILLIPFVFLLSMAMAFFLHALFTRIIGEKKRKTVWLRSVQRVLKWYLPLILFFACLSLYLHIALRFVLPIPSHLLVSDACLLYLIANAIVRFYATEIMITKKWVTKHLALTLVHRFKAFSLFVLIGSLVVIVFRGQWIPTPLTELAKTIYITIFTLLFSWLSWLVFRADFFKKRCSRFVTLGMKSILSLVFILVVVLAWNGYQHFAVFFIPNLIASLFILGMLSVVSIYLARINNILNTPGTPIADRLHFFMGMSSHKKLTEIFVIRLILNTGALLFSFYVLLMIWGAPEHYLEIFYDILKGSGVLVFSIKIVPVQLLRGAFIFCAILVLGRLFATHIARKKAFEGERDRQVTIATLITYVAFVLALVTGLTVAGVNFMRFALIAGALSVGIGFGLQNIAKDLVSGLVMLVNKPIRLGDYIVIDDIEGYVKKIRLLSTQVTTLDQSDMMIPNSYLLSKSISNYTYGNKLFKIDTRVVLMGGSDVEQAKRIMLEVVEKNPNVIQTAPHRPIVLYEISVSMGVVISVLDLWCVIKDVNRKHIVQSEINFAVVKALEEHGIELKIK